MNLLINKNIRTNQIIINEKDYNRIWKQIIKGTSIEKIWNIKVNVHAFENEKLRVSNMLCVSAIDNKLPPLLIAQGKEVKLLKKNILKIKIYYQIKFFEMLRK